MMGESKRRKTLDPNYGKPVDLDKEVAEQVRIWDAFVAKAVHQGKEKILIVVGVPDQPLEEKLVEAIVAFSQLEIAKKVDFLIHGEGGGKVLASATSTFLFKLLYTDFDELIDEISSTQKTTEEYSE